MKSGILSTDFTLYPEEAFHRRSVVAQILRHPHHGREGNHHVRAVEPYSPIGRDAHRIASWLASIPVYSFPNLPIFLFANPFWPLLRAGVQILAPRCIWIAAANNNSAGFLNLGLTHSGFAQATLLLGAADYDKAPRLEVVPARRLDQLARCRGQHLIRDW